MHSLLHHAIAGDATYLEKHTNIIRYSSLLPPSSLNCSGVRGCFCSPSPNFFSLGSTALQSSAADLWDTANVMLAKLLMDVGRHFTTSDGSAGYLDFLLTLGSVTIPYVVIHPPPCAPSLTTNKSKEKNAALMLDLCATELLIQSQLNLFGFEFTMCLHSVKVN